MSDHVKNDLRKTLRKQRSNLPLNYRQDAALQLCRKIEELPCYQAAKHIGMYQPISGEIELLNLWNTATLRGKFCYFPVLTNEKTLLFLPAQPATPFRKNRYLILEPDVPISQAIKVEEIDVLFLPLVAFDKHGTRLGMGAGYYDRTLASKKPKRLIGVAYDFQEQPFITPQEWDIPLDGVITPTQLIWRTP